MATAGGTVGDERQRLASIAAVTGELDRRLGDLAAAVAQLKELLLAPEPDGGTGEQP